MNPFRRTPPKQPPAPAQPPAAAQAAPRSEADELADLHNVMGVLLDDMVVAQRTPPNPPGGAPAAPAEDTPVSAATAGAAALQSAPSAPAAPVAPPPSEAQLPGAPAPANPNVGPQLLPAPDPSWAGNNGAPYPAAPVPPPAAPPSLRSNGPARPPMPPAPVGVSTVPPAPAQPLPSAAPLVQPPPVSPLAPAPPVQPVAAAGESHVAPYGVNPSGGYGAYGTGNAHTPHALRTPGDPYALPPGLDPNAVAIRGRGEGVAIEVGAGAWDDLLDLLSYRLEQTGVALRSTRIELDLGPRPLTEADLDSLRSVMAAYGMEPALVRTSAERTFMAALALGIATQQTTVDGLTVSEAQRGVAVDSPLGYFIFRGSLRSGQQLHRSEHVLIIGDVNPGAEVVSSGDILVWGRLRGTAHAGARGNPAAVIAALDMDPVQLRIDKVIGAAQAGATQGGPRWGGQRSATRRPEMARLVAGQLAVAEWDDARSGGAPLKRRRG
jgi:septum site-determining protein MinC